MVVFADNNNDIWFGDREQNRAARQWSRWIQSVFQAPSYTFTIYILLHYFIHTQSLARTK